MRTNTHASRCLFLLQYILVVFAKDNSDKTVDPPMEIPVLVLDKNDNQPMCSEGDTLLEVQENEPIGRQ